LGYDYFFPLYPPSAVPGGPATSGFIAFGDFGHQTMAISPIAFYLAGAAVA
jgi:hypothetical protein